MLWPDISRAGRVTSDLIRGMGVTQFVGTGNIDNISHKCTAAITISHYEVNDAERIRAVLKNCVNAMSLEDDGHSISPTLMSSSGSKRRKYSRDSFLVLFALGGRSRIILF